MCSAVRAGSRGASQEAGGCAHLRDVDCPTLRDTRPASPGPGRLQLAAYWRLYLHRLAVLAHDAQELLTGGTEVDVYWHGLYIQTLWVRTNLQGQGVGSALLNHLEAATTARVVPKPD
jgi:GNAT superfamily N-acetyltransferase